MKNYLNQKHRNRYRKNRGIEPVTLIIGARCKDGVVIAGDRRVLRGTEYSEEKKIVQPFPNFVVGASGISGLMDKFLYEMNFMLSQPKEKGKLTWRDFLYYLEDLAFQLHQRYAPRLEEDEDTEIGAYYFDVLYGFKEFAERATLYHMYRSGFSTEVKRFEIIGHGEPHALPFMKSLYHPSISMAEMVKLSCFILALIDEEKIDLSVGGKPQIFKIPDNGDARELAENEIDNLLKEISSPKDRLGKAIFS